MLHTRGTPRHVENNNNSLDFIELVATCLDTLLNAFRVFRAFEFRDLSN